MNFSTAVQALTDTNVDFMLIGGWAAILNGSTQTTRDLDICYARNRLNCARVVAALAPFSPRLRDFPVDLPFVWDAATLNNSSICTLTTSAGSIDLLSEVVGLGTYEQVKASSRQVEAFGRRVWTLDLKGLITAKRAAGRPKDLRALPELETLLETLED